MSTDVLRSQHVRSKVHESSLIATSRKRKLRELYAVSASEYPITQFNFLNGDASPPTPAEARFLEDNDIQQGRSLNEASIPTRRQLRSERTRKIPTKGPSSAVRSPERSRSKGKREDGTRKSRATTPAKTPVVGPMDAYLDASDSPLRGRSRIAVEIPAGPRNASNKESQTELPVASQNILDAIVDQTLNEAELKPTSLQDTPIPDEALEKTRLLDGVESREGSPGIDPKKAIPFSADDAAQMQEPHINGSEDEHHKAAIAHLPPRDVQEKHLRDVDQSLAERAEKEEKEKAGRLSINLPLPRDSRTSADVISSPGSTVDAQSATTPALHEASTDTSPDNDGYHADKMDEEERPETPPELAPSRKEVLEKEEHDRILKAQIELAKADILGSPPTDPDSQLRLEEEQAAAASSSRHGQEVAGDDDVAISGGNNKEHGSGPDTLVTEATETAQDIMDDEEDEVVGVPTPEDGKTSHRDAGQVAVPSGNHDEDAMDIDEAPAENSSTSEQHTTVDNNRLQDTALTPEKQPTNRKETPTATPPLRRTPSVPAPTAPLERMTTRVSSGAMRHKSVSEILGEIPKPNTNSSPDRTMIGKASAGTGSAPDSSNQSRSSTPQSPGSRIRSLVERAKEKERSKLSTVVFAKQATNKPSQSSALVPSTNKASTPDSSDYLLPLITAQATAMNRAQPLDALLQSAHKTITTSNAYVPFHEHQTKKILQRIYNLQSFDKWSLRQPKRSPEPNRPASHWDELLKEAKWMRTDFREERKWKTAVARNLANACAEWVAADADDRNLLQVKLAPLATGHSIDVKMTDSGASEEEEVNHPTPELVASAEHGTPIEEFDDEPQVSLLDAIPPTAMFALGENDVVFGLRRSPATEKLLGELPMYGVPLKVHSSGLPTMQSDPDASWKRPALPLSKYVEGKIVLKDEGPPRKKSRFQYDEEDDEDDQVVFESSGPTSQRSLVEPVQSDVALFNPENKHIRDRIHAGHQFRPPSEFPMPLQSFFECRSSSQWTWAEDDELKGLVREYQYNWSLISSMLATRSLFSSGAERRTPWECFERWIHLEGLPADMQKTHYFRAYNNRLEAAQRNLIQQAALAPPPQANAAGAAVTAVPRRRTTTSVRVERRRNQKHLTLVDAMRKLAKKRETSQQKQTHAAGLAAMRKANEVVQPQAVRHTPQDFSRLKHERELQMQERLARMQLQQEAQRRAAMQQARNPQQNPQQYPPHNGVPQQPRNPGTPNVAPPHNQQNNAGRPNQLAVPGQNLPHPPMQPMSNGMVAQLPMPNGHNGIPQMPLKGIPQAQMQGMQGMQPQHRLPVPNPAPNLNLVMQARQISEQQRQAIQMQQSQQQHQGQNPAINNSPPNMRNNVNAMSQQQAYMQNNPAMLASFNSANTNGASTPPANGMNVPSVGGSGSPRMGNPSQPQQHNGGNVSQVSKLENQFRANYPNATPDQIRKMVGDALNHSLAQQRQQISQSAMHAAAGGGGNFSAIPNGMQNSPQQYAQMLRAQQERQAASASQQTRSASAGSGLGK